MADRYWIGGASRDSYSWDQDYNWARSSSGRALTASGIPTISDAVYFDGGSTGYDCRLASGASRASISALSSWNKNFSSSGQTLTTAGTLSFDHTGTLTLDATVTLTGDGNFHLGSGVGTVTLTNCDLDLKGTGNLDIDKALASYTNAFRNITCSYSGKTTTDTGSAILYIKEVLTLHSSGTFAMGGNNIFLLYAGTVTPLVPDGATILGANGIYFMFSPQTTSTITLPAISISTVGYTGIQFMIPNTGVSLTVELTGTITVSLIYFNSQYTSGSVIFNTNNNTIVSATGWYTVQTTGTNTSSVTLNLGSSTITCSNLITSKDAGATCTINMGTSTWSVLNDLDLTGCSTFDAGTSQVTLSGSGHSIITSNSKSFYTVIIAKASNTYNVTLAAALACNTLASNSGASGNFTSATYAITSASSITFDSTGTLTLSGAVTITGDGNFTIASAGVITLTDCDVDLHGTGNFALSAGGAALKLFRNVTLGYPGKTTTWTTLNMGAYKGCSGILTVNGGTFTINSVIYGFIVAVPAGVTDPLVLVSGYAINGSSNLIIAPNGADCAFNIPAMTYGAVGTLQIVTQVSASGTATVTQTGAINCTSSGMTVSPYLGTSTIVYNTANYALTLLGVFLLESLNGSKSCTFNAGSSTITIGSLAATSHTGPTIYNLQTSTWICSGSWVYSVNASTTCDPGTSSVTFSGSAATAITSNGKSFYTVIVAKASNSYTVTLADALSCNTLTSNSGASGNFNAAGFAITSASTVSFSSTGTVSLGNVTITGDGNFHIESTSGTVTLSSASIDLKGTGNLDIDKTPAQYWVNLTCSYNGKTTTHTGAVDFYYSGVMTLASGGTFASGVNCAIYWLGSGTVTPLVQNGATFSFAGNGNFRFYPLGASTITVPAITLGSGDFYFLDLSGATITYNLTGHFLLTSGHLYFASQSSSSGIFNFNTGNYNITLNGAKNLYINQTTGTNTSTFVFTMGSSVVTIAGGAFLTSKDVGSLCTINMQTSAWSIDAQIDLTGVTTFTANTSSVTCIGTGNSTITSNGKSFYTVIVAKASNSYTVTLADALSCNTLTSNSGASGNFTAATFDITSVSSVTLDSTGTLLLRAVLITGDGNFHIGSAVGATTLTNCTVEMRGTGNFDIDKTGLTFPSVKFNADGKTISSTGDANYTSTVLYVEPGTTVNWKNGITVTISSYTTGDWDGTADKKVTFRSVSDGNTYAFTNPASMIVSYMDVKDSVASNQIDASNGTNVDSLNNTLWFFGRIALRFYAGIRRAFMMNSQNSI